MERERRRERGLFVDLGVWGEVPGGRGLRSWG
jgi:hypothetical protein